MVMVRVRLRLRRGPDSCPDGSYPVCLRLRLLVDDVHGGHGGRVVVPVLDRRPRIAGGSCRRRCSRPGVVTAAACGHEVHHVERRRLHHAPHESFERVP